VLFRGRKVLFIHISKTRRWSEFCLSYKKSKMKKAFYLILAGVAIGILVAPDKGSETWRKIKDGFDDWKEGAMNHINDMASQAKELLGEGEGAADTAKNEVRETVNQW
jgi:gas vesicle protein